MVTSVAGDLAFALGRIIDVTTAWTFENHLYDEVPVFADLNDDPDPQRTEDNFTIRNSGISRTASDSDRLVCLTDDS